MTAPADAPPAAFTAYPNPFTTAETLMDGVYAPQRYRVVWDAAGRASGLYAARRRIGTRSRTVLLALRR